MANAKLRYLGDDKPEKGSYNGVSFSIKDGIASVPEALAVEMATSYPGLWSREDKDKVDAKKRAVPRARRAEAADRTVAHHRQIAQEDVRPGYVVVPREVTPKQADKLIEAQVDVAPAPALKGGEQK